MSKADLVSVVVPLYNKKRYVKRALNSILNQSHQNIELIVVDDGSTDGSLEVAKAVADPRIRIIVQQNQGPGRARNVGANESGAEILAFLDADDLWHKNYLEKGLNLMKEYNVAVVVQGAILNNGESFYSKLINKGVYNLKNDPMPLKTVNTLLSHMSCSNSVIMRKNIFKNYGGFFDNYNCTYGEDAFLMIKILFNEPVCFDLDHPTVVVDRSASRLSNNRQNSPEIPPYLSRAIDLLSDIPNNRRALARRLLIYRALAFTKSLVASGYPNKAMKVILYAVKLLRYYPR